MPGQLHYDLNLGAFGTFSPVSTRSAPISFPFAGHPYFGPNTLFHTLHELMVNKMAARKKALIKERVFISDTSFSLQRYKLINIILILQLWKRPFDEKARFFAGCHHVGMMDS
ncbi:MAG TPA: hypothetical protein VKI61_07890 [Chitinophagaceae bacterium]|jgi:hypothetical protein|nr:hypothetical protein [Chitinophagaceae bacterium]